MFGFGARYRGIIYQSLRLAADYNVDIIERTQSTFRLVPRHQNLHDDRLGQFRSRADQFELSANPLPARLMHHAADENIGNGYLNGWLQASESRPGAKA